MKVQNLTYTTRPPRLALGVPTRNEEAGIALVLGRIADALRNEPTRIMVLDDSDDATCARVTAFAATDAAGPHQITLVHREPRERRGRLGSAVMLGLELASEEGVPEYFAIIDADGQHDEEALEKMIAKADETGADVVVASRYIEGGEAGGLGSLRLLVSKSVTLLARALFPRRLAGLTDVPSGMFLVRIKSVQPELVRPDGFKILFAMLAVHDWTSAEIHYVFGDRVAGESKAGVAEGLRFLRLVARTRLRNWREAILRSQPAYPPF